MQVQRRCSAIAGAASDGDIATEPDGSIVPRPADPAPCASHPPRPFHGALSRCARRERQSSEDSSERESGSRVTLTIELAYGVAVQDAVGIIRDEIGEILQAS